MDNLKYSVLMSVYEGEKPLFLDASIKSILRQTYMPEQIVVVKDGPINKNLETIIKTYHLEYPELFTIVPLSKNVGLGKALNEGLKRCRNELVARMDTDDISLDCRCELQVREFMNDTELTIVGANIDEFYDNPDHIISSRIVPTKHEDILKFSKRRNPFNHPTVMYKKSKILKLGGYGDFRRNQDLELFVRLLNSGYQAKNIDKSLLYFRANEDNLKRRKSWKKCSSYISMIYRFWRRGYSSFIDLIIVSISQIIIFASPLWFLDWVSNTFLRRKK